MICGVVACGSPLHPAEAQPQSPPAVAATCSVEALPKPAAISNVAMTCTTPSGEATSFSTEAVAAIFERPVTVPCDVSDGWSYAPWCSGTIAVEGRQRQLTLYLGGRGRLASERGDVLFSFDAATFMGSTRRASF